MKKFIELHGDGFPIIVNLDDVRRIESHEEDNSCSMLLTSSNSDGVCKWFKPDESYADVRMIIASAQGGFHVHGGTETARGLD